MTAWNCIRRIRRINQTGIEESDTASRFLFESFAVRKYIFKDDDYNLCRIGGFCEIEDRICSREWKIDYNKLSRHSRIYPATLRDVGPRYIQFSEPESDIASLAFLNVHGLMVSLREQTCQPRLRFT